MSEPLRHPLLEGCGVEHGFGVRGAREVPGVVRPRQVHGASVARVDGASRTSPCEADAVVSNVAGLPIGVVTADCVPILLASESGDAVAAIHAGWRGLARGVVHAGVAALREEAGSAPLRAVIGPHIGPCCYEVDEPVLDALAERFASRLQQAKYPARPGHAQLDLGTLATEALLVAGLAAGSVSALAACTSCDSTRFHSFRRDGPRAGRLGHFIAARSDEA